jgi:hypothetical protein
VPRSNSAIASSIPSAGRGRSVLGVAAPRVVPLKRHPRQLVYEGRRASHVLAGQRLVNRRCIPLRSFTLVLLDVHPDVPEPPERPEVRAPVPDRPEVRAPVPDRPEVRAPVPERPEVGAGVPERPEVGAGVPERPGVGAAVPELPQLGAVGAETKERH